METILALLIAHKWMALAVAVTGYLARLSKDDSRFPVSIPSRYRPVLVLVLGQGYAVLQATQNGMPWQEAIKMGLTTSVWTLGLYSLVIKALFNGTEPAWMKTLALVFPAPPSPAPTPAPTPAPSQADVPVTVDQAPDKKVDATPKAK